MAEAVLVMIFAASLGARFLIGVIPHLRRDVTFASSLRPIFKAFFYQRHRRGAMLGHWWRASDKSGALRPRSQATLARKRLSRDMVFAMTHRISWLLILALVLMGLLAAQGVRKANAQSISLIRDADTE